MRSRSDVAAPSGAPRVLIASTAMLAFITFWQAAAIVLNDMGSSAFYAGAIAEHFVGKTAPWFILAIMVLAYAVRSVYIESCSMFVRGGVYRVVKEAMGSTLAKVSVSALMPLTDTVTSAIGASSCGASTFSPFAPASSSTADAGARRSTRRASFYRSAASRHSRVSWRSIRMPVAFLLWWATFGRPDSQDRRTRIPLSSRSRTCAR